MFKKFNFLLVLFFSINFISAQQSDFHENESYVDLFISANGTIYLETNKIAFEEIQNKVSENIRNRPFKLDQKIVFRIFADENLKLGYIIDANQEMISAYDEKVRTDRYLLNTVKLNIDGQNWFDSVDMNKLKKMN